MLKKKSKYHLLSPFINMIGCSWFNFTTKEPFKSRIQV